MTAVWASCVVHTSRHTHTRLASTFSCPQSHKKVIFFCAAFAVRWPCTRHSPAYSLSANSNLPAGRNKKLLAFLGHFSWAASRLSACFLAGRPSAVIRFLGAAFTSVPGSGIFRLRVAVMVVGASCVAPTAIIRTLSQSDVCHIVRCH